MDRELLIEIGVEELPASWLPDLTVQLAKRLEARLKEYRILPGAPVESFSTPRRLTARVAGIAERQDDLDETITGPPVSAAYGADGQPAPAALGFAKKQGVPFEQLTRVKTPKGEYLACQKRHRGRSAVDTLPDILGAVLRDLAFPKQMHWDARLEDGRGELLFGRPIRWLLFLYGGRVVPFTIGRSAAAASSGVQEIESGAVTYGHRFLATSGRPGRSIKVRSFEEYEARLSEHFVVLAHRERRDRIARELELHARRMNGRVALKEHAALIDEVADLVEYPGVVAGFFDAAFLALPEEVLTTTLVHHQHWFPVVNERGELREAFLAVVNTQPQDERVIARNAERVVTARLRDARFFWESDRKTRLAARLDRLHTVLFHKKLGSYRDKAERIEKLAEWIAGEALGRPDAVQHAATAARLAKADLTTDMVFEFPELQGKMGGIYAREEGQPEAVWKAIYHQYLPIGVEADAPPTRAQLGEAGMTWAAVSLADKLDTVTGLFSAGERPTGSRDPFGIRRNAQGAVRILMDLPELTGIDREVALDALIAEAAKPFASTASEAGAEPAAHGFWRDRIRFALEQRGFPAGEASAVLQRGLTPLRTRRVAEALAKMRGSQDLLGLAEIFKRVKNISKDVRFESSWEALLDYARTPATEAAERQLIEFLAPQVHLVDEDLKQHKYLSALQRISKLRAPVAEYFQTILVMAEDPDVRRQRLQLMAGLRNLVTNIADISEIVPQTE